jgi:hypothetical protein
MLFDIKKGKVVQLKGEVKKTKKGEDRDTEREAKIKRKLSGLTGRCSGSGPVPRASKQKDGHVPLSANSIASRSRWIITWYIAHVHRTSEHYHIKNALALHSVPSTPLAPIHPPHRLISASCVLLQACNLIFR